MRNGRWVSPVVVLTLFNLSIAFSMVAPPLKAEESIVSDAEESDGKRPKICLVLSGGGARGAAHVGVLKVLEEYRVPIDCIVGTSMGSLVGAAYATGTTLPEIDEIIAGITSELLFKDTPPRKELAMRRKQDDYTILFGPEFGVSSDGPALGKGVVSGVQLETVLRKLSKEKGYLNFDELPIQYRAVATNLENGTEVVFSEGNLASVMRASMSVPGAVAPAVADGVLLVDGMLTRNLPVETARALGADVVIAVNVGTPLLQREQLNGILGVGGQMLSILTEQNVQESIAALQPQDILISPELGEFTTADFDSLTLIAPLGEVAARTVEDKLRALSIADDDYAAWRKTQQYRPAPPPPPVDEIRFVNLKRVNPASALAIMETKVGQPINEKTLDRDMRRLYGTGDFEHVNYRYIQEGDRRILAVEAVEKEWGPDYLRLGLGLSSDFSGDAYFNILASYRETWLNSLGAEWRTDIQFGHNNSVGTEFYQPLSTDGLFFIAPHIIYQQAMVDLYNDGQRIATYDIDQTLAGIDIGSHFYRYGELRLGVAGGVANASLDTGVSLLPQNEDVKQGAYLAKFVLDQIDSAHFPRSGWRMVGDIFKSSSDLGADDDYTRWMADAAGAYSIGEHTFLLGLTAGDSIGSDPLPGYDQFQWGGFLRQSGYSTDELIGGSLRFGKLMYYRQIMRGGMLEGAYGGISLELGKVDQPLVSGNPDGWLRSGSIYIAADSPLGPAYLAYGRTDDGEGSLYFYLGVPY